MCKMSTSKTQVNFDMQHNQTLCTSANTQSVLNYDYTLALYSPNIHTLILL